MSVTISESMQAVHAITAKLKADAQALVVDMRLNPNRASLAIDEARLFSDKISLGVAQTPPMHSTSAAPAQPVVASVELDSRENAPTHHLLDVRA
jgi:hypothetical protein